MVVATSKTFGGSGPAAKTVTVTFQNNTGTGQLLTGLSITWPQATNGNLQQIKMGGTTIYNTSTGNGSLTTTLLLGTNCPADDRRGFMRNLDVYLPAQRQHDPQQLHWFGNIQPVWARYDVAIKGTARFNNEGPAQAGPSCNKSHRKPGKQPEGRLSPTFVAIYVDGAGPPSARCPDVLMARGNPKMKKIPLRTKITLTIVGLLAMAGVFYSACGLPVCVAGVPAAPLCETPGIGLARFCRAFDSFAPALSPIRASRLSRSRPRGSAL